MDVLFLVVVRLSRRKSDCPQLRKTLLETWIPDAYFRIGTKRRKLDVGGIYDDNCNANAL